MRPRLVAGLMVCGSIVARTAAADESPAVASALFDEGRALMLDGRFPEACEKFSQSVAAEPRVGSRLNLAACYEKTGRVASALSIYEHVLVSDERNADQDRLARERVAVLGPRVPQVQLRVKNVKGLVVLLGATPLTPGQSIHADPGAHSVVASAPGFQPWTGRVVLEEGKSATVDIPALQPLPAPIPASPQNRSLPGKVSRSAPPAKPPQAVQRAWHVDASVWAGYMGVSNGSVEPTHGQYITLDSVDGTNKASCTRGQCPLSVAGHAVGMGLSLGAEYEVWHRVSPGIRVMAGPTAGGGAGWVFLAAATVRLEASENMWLRPSVLLGEITVANVGDVDSAEYRVDPNLELTTSVGDGVGFGIEIGKRVAKLPIGELSISVMPFFISDQGHGYGLPVSAALRY